MELCGVELGLGLGRVGGDLGSSAAGAELCGVELGLGLELRLGQLYR